MVKALRDTALGAAMFLASQHSVHAEDFYEGKTVEILVSSAAGSGYDVIARAVANKLGDHVSGNPTFIVRNMPGAGGIVLGNFMAEQAPRDGTVIAATQNSIPIANLLNPEGVNFDPMAFSWIGSVTRTLYVGYVLDTSPVQSFEEAFDTEVVLGGTSAGTFSVDIAKISNALLGTKFRMVPGFESAGAIRLSMERGEVQGYLGDSWNSLLRTNPDWVEDGKVRVIVQHNSEPNPQIPGNVPSLMDFAKTDQQREAFAFQLARLEHGRPFYAPPGVPEERLTLLRRAFDAVIEDPEFRDEMMQMDVVIDGPLTGEELAELVRLQQETSPETLQMLRDLLDGDDAD